MFVLKLRSNVRFCLFTVWEGTVNILNSRSRVWGY